MYYHRKASFYNQTLKGEKALSDIGSSDLAQVARDYGVSVDTVSGLNLLNSFVAGLGNEPKVIGAAFALENGQTSEPILGNSGVFILKTINKTEAGDAANIAFLRRTITEQSKNVAERIRSGLEHFNFSDVAPGLHVTVSIGMASYMQYKSIQETLMTADNRMYKAKEQGRNKIVFE